MKLERVQPGDVVRCAIKGRTGIYGEVTEIKDGIVYFRPLCPATGLAARERARGRRPLAESRTPRRRRQRAPGAARAALPAGGPQMTGRRAPRDTSPPPMSTADVGERSHTSPVGRLAPRPYDLAAVCSEQALTCPVNGERCESITCVDVGCTAADANVDAGRAA